jgi:FAD/FMN-containing dehydrogenase
MAPPMSVGLKRRRLDSEACDPALARRLRREIAGEVLLDAFARGRYSTDASIYQVEPQAVVVPRTDADVQAALALAREFGVSITARGGGTSQAGQTIPSIWAPSSSSMKRRARFGSSPAWCSTA